MAKQADVEQPQEAAQGRTLPMPKLPSVNSHEAVLQEYGITPESTYMPSPPTTQKENLDSLTILTTQVMDERGNPIKNVEGHSGPMLYLEKQGERDGNKYDGYDGFYMYLLLHPHKGKVVITIGRKIGDKQPDIVRFLDTLKAGAWIQVAKIKTSSGNHTFVPVPVQR